MQEPKNDWVAGLKNSEWLKIPAGRKLLIPAESLDIGRSR